MINQKNIIVFAALGIGAYIFATRRAMATGQSASALPAVQAASNPLGSLLDKGLTAIDTLLGGFRSATLQPGLSYDSTNSRSVRDAADANAAQWGSYAGGGNYAGYTTGAPDQYAVNPPTSFEAFTTGTDMDASTAWYMQ